VSVGVLVGVFVGATHAVLSAFGTVPPAHTTHELCAESGCTCPLGHAVHDAALVVSL
jgi:hypothetical protein